MKTIYADVDYISGHTRYGHYELSLTDEQYEEFKSLSEDEQRDWIKDGELIVDDCYIEDVGNLGNIRVSE